MERAMKDFLGKEISVGKTLVYPIRRGSFIGMGQARVIEFGDKDDIKAVAKANRRGVEYEVSVTLVDPGRCVVVD